MSRTQKSKETENTLISANVRGASFWGVKMLWNLTVVMIAQFCKYAELNHWTVHFKWANCMVCDLFINKTAAGKNNVNLIKAMGLTTFIGNAENAWNAPRKSQSSLDCETCHRSNGQSLTCIHGMKRWEGSCYKIKTWKRPKKEEPNAMPGSCLNANLNKPTLIFETIRNVYEFGNKLKKLLLL